MSWWGGSDGKIDKSQIMPRQQHKRREPGEIVYIQRKGEEGKKRYAWSFAEPLLISGQWEMVEGDHAQERATGR
jgi:hypothetical protein